MRMKPRALSVLSCAVVLVGVNTLRGQVTIAVDMDTAAAGVQATRNAAANQVFDVDIVMTVGAAGVSSYGVSADVDTGELILQTVVEPALTEFPVTLDPPSPQVCPGGAPAGRICTLDGGNLGAGASNMTVVIAKITFRVGTPVTDGTMDITLGTLNTGLDGIFDNAGQAVTPTFVGGGVNVSVGCQGQPNGTPCADDGNVCTLDVCMGGACTHPNQPNGTACTDDGNACTSDVCAAGVCTHPAVAGTPPCTDDGNPCTNDVCSAGTCTHPNRPNGTACTSDGNACTTDACSNGVCTNTPRTCPSGQICNPANGNCETVPCTNDLQCNDNNVCTRDVCNLLTGVCGNTSISPPPAGCETGRGSFTKKGSLLIFSKVEILYQGAGFPLVQDTFIDLSNDYPDDVYVQLYFVNGDPPLPATIVGGVVQERAHPGWNWADCQILLTANQPAYFSVATGLPIGCQPFTVLDPGSPPGRPNPDVAGGRMRRGFVYAWAVNNLGQPIRWNHLSGDAALIHYAFGTSAEYNAYAFSACPGDPGLCPHGAAVPLSVSANGLMGRLLLDGVHYDFTYDKLLLDFYARNNPALQVPPNPTPPLSGPTHRVDHNLDVTLHPLSADLKQDGRGPITTKAKYDVWNQNEIRLSGMTRCITCWDQTLVTRYGNPNYFLREFLQTDKGKARIDGIGSDTVCDVPARGIVSEDAAILGISIKLLTFRVVNAITGFAASALNMVGQGEEIAQINWDIIAGPDRAVKVQEDEDLKERELDEDRE